MGSGIAMPERSLMSMNAFFVVCHLSTSKPFIIVETIILQQLPNSANSFIHYLCHE